MKIIVGLGNPGEKYAGTRHNVGFMAVDKIVERVASDTFQNVSKFNAEILRVGEIIYAKPQTFMNDSGKSVAPIVNFYKVDMKDLYIIHDDLDIALGNFKIQFGKGPRIHNGLLSVEEHLGTDQFWNVRVGVENRAVRGNKGIPGVQYSLQNFSAREKSMVDDVIAQVVEQVLAIR